jgi:hypothetical protein
MHIRNEDLPERTLEEAIQHELMPRLLAAFAGAPGAMVRI